jgi:hypothetical protein
MLRYYSKKTTRAAGCKIVANGKQVGQEAGRRQRAVLAADCGQAQNRAKSGSRRERWMRSFYLFLLPQSGNDLLTIKQNSPQEGSLVSVQFMVEVALKTKAYNGTQPKFFKTQPAFLSFFFTFAHCLFVRLTFKQSLKIKNINK